MRKHHAVVALAAAISFAAIGASRGQTPASAPAPEATANHQAMMAAVERLRRDVQGAPVKGDMDVDFVDLMIFHHQGAIDMANLYLSYGRDPMIRTMVQRIVVDREREIAEFRVWQGKHPAPDRWLAEQAAPAR